MYVCVQDHKGSPKKDARTLGKVGVSNCGQKWKGGGRGFICMWTSFSVCFLEEIRGHLKVIYRHRTVLKIDK